MALCALSLGALGCPGFLPGPHTDQTDLFVCVLDPACTRVLAVAHRGGGLEAPENSIAGFAYAWDVGADSVELDVRTSGDGALVLMHDASVDRTTNGSGDVSTLTLPALQGLVVHSPDGAVPDGEVPTFAEALDYLDGRMLAVVDVKDADEAEVLAQAAAAGMLDQLIFLVGSVAEALTYAALEPDAVLMGAADSEAEVIAFLALTDVPLIHVGADLVTAAGVASVHQAGAKVFASALGVLDARARIFGADQYAPLVDDAVDLVQTDFPSLLVPWLADRNAH